MDFIKIEIGDNMLIAGIGLEELGLLFFLLLPFLLAFGILVLLFLIVLKVYRKVSKPPKPPA